jgi:hypothetical protein
MFMFQWLKWRFYRAPVFMILLPVVMGVMAACSPHSPDIHQARTPPLTLEAFFEGETVAYGIFEDRYGNLKRQFRVNITGVVNGNTLILDEHFLYDDGETDHRVWTITNLGMPDAGLIRYEGAAADVIGVASGQISGNALNWTYDIDLAVGDSSLRVKFDDWIYQQDKNVAINRAYVSKFGIHIGSVTLVFLRGDLAGHVYPLDLENWPE